MRCWLINIFILLNLFATGQSPFQLTRQLTSEADYERACGVLDSCYQKKYHPDSVLYYKCIVQLKTGKVKEARGTCRKLMRNFPDFKFGHYVNGLVLFSEMDYGRCIDEFTRALEVNPTHFNALYNRSLAFGMLEDYLLAIGDLDKCIELDPGSSSSYFSRAYWYEFTGKYAEAAMDYEKTIQLDPKNYDAYMGLAFTHQVQNNNAKACEVINKAIVAGSQIAEDLKVNYCR
jgi:tetratricopeptide (TPR) repeat protein